MARCACGTESQLFEFNVKEMAGRMRGRVCVHACRAVLSRGIEARLHAVGAAAEALKFSFLLGFLNTGSRGAVVE